MDQQDRFREIKEKHDFNDIEIAYYYDRWIALNKRWNALKQEFPITPEEAFVSSGDKVFDMEKVEELKKQTVEGKVVNNWTYYEDYKPGHRYALGADVSEGIGKDSSTIVVVDFTYIKPKVVAEFNSNRIDPVNFAYEIKNGGTMYGGCLVAPENNYYGHTTIQTLKSMYFNIYTEEKRDKQTNQISEKLGWKTTSVTKPKIIFDLVDAVNKDEIEVPSKWLVDEMRTYTQDDIAQIKFDEEQTRHWDRLIALAIAWQMRDKVQLNIDPETVKTKY
jgi:hypothetical protein